MLEQLSFVLTPRVSHEYSELIRHGFEVLNRLGFTDYEYELSAIINTADVLDSHSFILGVTAVLNAGLNVVLSEHDMVLYFEDEDLEAKIDAAEALQTISEFNEPDALIAHTDCEDITNEEIMACLLAEVTDYDDTFWLPRIVSVTPALIAAISERAHTLRDRNEWGDQVEHEEEEAERREVKARARQRARNFKNTTKAHPLYAMKLITEGLPAGRPASQYVDPIRDDLLELSSKDAELAAQNILFAALLSDMDDGQILSASQHICEDIYGVARMQALVHGHLNDEYQKVETNGDA